ncbi:MAG: serine hydrolase [Eubacteriales bacterium]
MEFSLQNFLEQVKAQGLGLYGIVVRQGGQVIAEHHTRRDNPVNLYSASKSFTSLGIGIAIDEGLLSSVDELVLPYFAEALQPGYDRRLEQLTVRHLLTMTAGFGKHYLLGQLEDPNCRDYAAYILAQPLATDPGTRFFYSNASTYLLSALITKLTGQSLRDYLMPRLFEPLGIPFPQWFSCPRGISHGCSGLFLRTEHLSRFAQLLLQGGVYEGKRLVSEAYVRAATSPQVNSWGDQYQGTRGGVPADIASPSTSPAWYGFQFWCCENEPGAFQASGAFDQFALVVPNRGLAIGMTAHEETRCAYLHTALWDEIVYRFPVVN